MAVRKNNFKKTAQLVMAQQKSKKQYEKAQKLEDIIPLFEPHKFWDMQPVPKPTDILTLSDDHYDKAIETK